MALTGKPDKTEMFRFYPVYPIVNNNDLAQAIGYVKEYYPRGITKYRHIGSNREIPLEQVDRWIEDSRNNIGRVIKIRHGL